MRFGVALPHFSHLAAPGPITEITRAAEDNGYHSVWASDHVIVPAETPFLPDELTEILATLAYLAGKTTRVTLGTSVLVAPYRPALFTAKYLSTLDVLAEGRLAVAVGVGRLEAEFEALGVTFDDKWSRTDEDLKVWRDLWTTDSSSFDGQWSSYRDVRMFPKGHEGRSGPPVYFGGGGPRAIRRAALADGWHPIVLGTPEPPQEISHYEQACRDAGRPRGQVQVRYMAGYPTVDVEAWPFSGDSDERLQQAQRFADAGVDELIIDATMLALSNLSAAQIVSLLERFAREVIEPMGAVNE
ncbi:TIGR03619 family F420-dependent LLM class oxidoreductase [Mycobacterium sp. CBMA271]|uniref:TIGR03619 family F420-dependent LLM class oxidoreductase n=1 Tax=unclassified Mycobacteroides TaxID=2618759 RepID=UPI0012DC8F7F|nr:MULTISPECIES: TIGR03619 family F420-dependent LLM class oxidoreductase [unclassified Mycobacteroides]MUM17851.1 hypothetical protein [Mycobacteroides sp. CBMA 326]MUM20422.1 TIGR03619 family F420-dependent LLM class oxidoreductase [Mycobacteroides sp. CBMA 271]